jgi:hypothetical protein
MVLFCMDDRNLSIQPENDEQYDPKSQMKAFFRCFNFDMGNVGLIVGHCAPPGEKAYTGWCEPNEYCSDFPAVIEITALHVPARDVKYSEPLLCIFIRSFPPRSANGARHAIPAVLKTNLLVTVQMPLKHEF